MKKIAKIIGKNFKLLMRSKSSALTVILGPLLIIFIVGIAFSNTGTSSLRLGVYSPSYSNLTESFIDRLGADQFSIVRLQSEQTCIEQIKLGNTHACIVFPPEMDIENNQTNEITFYVDYSKINIVYMVVGSLREGVAERESELSLNMTNVLLSKLQNAQSTSEEQQEFVDALIEDNSELKTELDDIKTNLDQMNVGFDVDDFETDAASSRIRSSKTKIESLQSKAESVISSTEDLIDEVNAISGLPAEVTDAINDTETELNELEEEMDTITGEGINSSDEAIELIESIESKLSDVRSELDSLNTKKATVKTKIDSVKSMIDENSEQLQSLKNLMQQTISDISSIEVTEASNIVNPISTNIKPISAEASHLTYMFPSLLVLVIMFISILLSSNIVLMEKKSKAYFRNFTTPTKDVTFVLGTYLTNLILVLMQIILIVGIASYFFNTSIITNYASIALIVIIIITFFTFVGMGIGYISSSQETSTLAAISFGSIFLFLSDMVFPLENMPQYIMNIAVFNPFVISSFILRKALLFNAPIIVSLEDMLILLEYSVSLFVLILIIQKVSKMHLLRKQAIKPEKIDKEKKGYKSIEENPQEKQKAPEQKEEEQEPDKEVVEELHPDADNKLEAIKERIMPSLSPEQHLKLESGQEIKSIRELRDAVHMMGEDTFKKYVAGEKNAFADWIDDAYKKKELAEKLRKQASKKKAFKVLKKYVKKTEKELRNAEKIHNKMIKVMQREQSKKKKQKKPKKKTTKKKRKKEKKSAKKTQEKKEETSIDHKIQEHHEKKEKEDSSTTKKENK